MHKKNSVGVGIGTTSIIMVFVVLCLTVFGVLALISVDGDYKLTKKTSKSIINFYKADSEAEGLLAQLDEVLVKAGIAVEKLQLEHTTLTDEKGRLYYREYIKKELTKIPELTLRNEENVLLEVTYQVPVDPKQELQVKVQINDYKESKGNRYTILEWTLKTLADWEYEEIEFEDIMIGQ